MRRIPQYRQTGVRLWTKFTVQRAVLYARGPQSDVMLCRFVFTQYFPGAVVLTTYQRVGNGTQFLQRAQNTTLDARLSGWLLYRIEGFAEQTGGAAPVPLYLTTFFSTSLGVGPKVALIWSSARLPVSSQCGQSSMAVGVFMPLAVPAVVYVRACGTPASDDAVVIVVEDDLRTAPGPPTALMVRTVLCMPTCRVFCVRCAGRQRRGKELDVLLEPANSRWWQPHSYVLDSVCTGHLRVF